MRELSHKIDVTSLAREAPAISPPIASNKRFRPALPAIAHRPINGALSQGFFIAMPRSLAAC